MRRTLFASAVLLGTSLAVPGFAQNTTPEQYLLTARQAIQDHSRDRALSALDCAEALVLDIKAAPSRGEGFGDPPVVRDIGHAREAVGQQNWAGADEYINEAMRHPSVHASVAAGMPGTQPQ